MKPTGLIKEMDTATLKRLSDRALALKFDNGPNDRFWKEVDPDGVHVCAQSYYHSPNLAFWRGIDHGYDFSHNGGVNVRAVVLCKMKDSKKPTHLLCDFDEQDFLALPDLKVDSPKRRAQRRKQSSKRKKRLTAAKAQRANERSHA